jgi:hypothetical protein
MHAAAQGPVQDNPTPADEQHRDMLSVTHDLAEQTIEEADGPLYADGAEAALRQPEDWLSLLPADALQLIVSLAGPVHSVSATGALSGPLMARTCRALRQACGMDRVLCVSGLRLEHHPSAEPVDAGRTREQGVGGPGLGAPEPGGSRGAAVAAATPSPPAPLNAPEGRAGETRLVSPPSLGPAALCWPDLLSRVATFRPRSLILEECTVRADELRVLHSLLPLSVLAILRCHSAGGALRALLRATAEGTAEGTAAQGPVLQGGQGRMGGASASSDGQGCVRDALEGSGGQGRMGDASASSGEGGGTALACLLAPSPPVLHALLVTGAADPIPPEAPTALFAPLRLLCLCECVIHVNWLTRALSAMHGLRALFLGGCAIIGLPDGDVSIHIGSPPAVSTPGAALPGMMQNREHVGTRGGAARLSGLRLIEATFCPPRLVAALSEAYPEARMIDFCRGEPADLSALVPAVEALVGGGASYTGPLNGARPAAAQCPRAVSSFRDRADENRPDENENSTAGASPADVVLGENTGGGGSAGNTGGGSAGTGKGSSGVNTGGEAPAGSATAAAQCRMRENTDGGTSIGNTGGEAPAGLATAAAECRMGRNTGGGTSVGITGGEAPAGLATAAAECRMGRNTGGGSAGVNTGGGGTSCVNTGGEAPVGLATALRLAVRAAAQCRMGGRGPTPLHHAALEGNGEMVRGLLMLGASALTKVRGGE